MPAPRGRIAYLDLIRCTAILAVLAVHLGAPIAPGPLLRGGYVGVDIFFVLSGYIITRLLIARPLPYRTFVARRVRRLVPALAALLVVGLPIALIAGRVPAGEALTSAGVAATISGPFLLGHDGPGLDPFGICWSLAIEWYFYLLWPLVLPWISAARRRPWLLLGLAVVLYLVSAAFVPPWWFYFGPSARFAQLLLGCWLAFTTAEDGGVLGARRPGGRVTTAVLTLAGAAVVAWVVFGPYENSVAYRAVGFPLVTLATAVWVWLGGVVEPAVARSKLLGLAAGLGLVSYSVYLWHQFFFRALPPSWLLGSRSVSYAAMLVLAAVVSALSYRYAERPFLRARPRPLAEEPAGR